MQAALEAHKRHRLRPLGHRQPLAILQPLAVEGVLATPALRNMRQQPEAAEEAVPAPVPARTALLGRQRARYGQPYLDAAAATLLPRDSPVRAVVVLHQSEVTRHPRPEARAERVRLCQQARALPVGAVAEARLVGLVAQRKVVAPEDNTLYPTVPMALQIPAVAVAVYIALRRRISEETVAAASCWCWCNDGTLR